MRVLNTFSGLGGNRRLWPDGLEVTAVEYRQDLATFYRDHYPQDTVICGDAFDYILKHYREFDYIWASVPCPSHSRARFWGSKGDNTATEPVYPDMRLYEVILFLQHYFDGDWVVENVKPFYKPLIEPQYLGRHCFWSNYHIPDFEAKDADIQGGVRQEWQELHGIDISGYKFQDRTDKILRNCVHPELGLHVFESARSSNPETIDQMSLI